jgi:hypothetical protein
VRACARFHGADMTSLTPLQHPHTTRSITAINRIAAAWLACDETLMDAWEAAVGGRAGAHDAAASEAAAALARAEERRRRRPPVPRANEGTRQRPYTLAWLAEAASVLADNEGARAEEQMEEECEMSEEEGSYYDEDDDSVESVERTAGRW